MLDEKKICLMTKLARLESKISKDKFHIVRYQRSDYIGLGLLKNFIYTTLGYLLIWGVIIAYNMEYLLDNLHKVKISAVVVEFIVGYLIFMIMYSVITYIKRRRQYEEAERDVAQYYAGLEELSRRYYRETKKENGRESGRR
ncbi:MAG: hypothetical protein ACOX8H_03920 [Ruminococcus sp.]|jgi:cell division protein FtsB